MEENPLTPLETAMRVLRHAKSDVSYEEIIRQLRILEQIEMTMRDVLLAGSGGDAPVETKDEKFDEISVSLPPPGPSFVVRDRPLVPWQSLAERTKEPADTDLWQADWDL
jgi:hypothetical protein